MLVVRSGVFPGTNFPPNLPLNRVMVRDQNEREKRQTSVNEEMKKENIRKAKERDEALILVL